MPAAPEVSLVVGGALGTHTIRVLDGTGSETARLCFDVDAQTHIEDGGPFRELFDILNRTMRCYRPDGVESIQWRGKTYRCFVSWILDHSHTAKGMQFFSPVTAEAADLYGQAQRKDGMIWSFAHPEAEGYYHESAYASYGYARRDGGVLFARQPVENHNEANFVDTIYLAWKGSGADAWMKRLLPRAMRALDYSVTDRARWSDKFRLLKRAYTIDSWDFQPRDEYLVKFRLGTEQMIDPERTKFGVFFGDNTGYAYACDQLAEMLTHAGRKRDAAKYRRRAGEIRQRLNEIAWNGHCFTHRIEEDPAVERDFGVDEKAQLAMSNAYSLNRGIPHEQCVAILRTYQALRARLPKGSPGEWYAIYPPFERGFGKDSAKWQYMNAGVHGHAAGELARGALKHGFERYGADVLRRLGELGKAHDGMVYFAYTGATEAPPPPQTFAPVSIAAQANMDLCDATQIPELKPTVNWMAADAGNDMRHLPVGRQELAGVAFEIADPAKNGRRAAVAVAQRQGLPERVEIPVGAKAGAIYLLHSVGGIGPSNVAGSMTLRYADGTKHTTYIQVGKHVTGWWFPALKTEHAGVAWRGPNAHSTDVGVCWAALANPQPEKEIAAVAFAAAEDGAIYAVLGLTLSDRMPYVPPKAVSFGGPDNWAGALCMLALIEGLAGVESRKPALEDLSLSPRWVATDATSVEATVRYPASKGYVAYRFHHDAAKRQLELTLTGSAERAELRVLLPVKATKLTGATIGGKRLQPRVERVENSLYAVFTVTPRAVTRVRIAYRSGNRPRRAGGVGDTL